MNDNDPRIGSKILSSGERLYAEGV